MTINQTLDRIVTKYTNSEIQNYPELNKIKSKLFELKLKMGGNTEVKNSSQILSLIQKTIKTN